MQSSRLDLVEPEVLITQHKDEIPLNSIIGALTRRSGRGPTPRTLTAAGRTRARAGKCTVMSLPQFSRYCADRKRRNELLRRQRGPAEQQPEPQTERPFEPNVFFVRNSYNPVIGRVTAIAKERVCAMFQ